MISIIKSFIWYWAITYKVLYYYVNYNIYLYASGGVADEYKPPFHDHVAADPSCEDMRKVVVVQEIRPLISNHWQHNVVRFTNTICIIVIVIVVIIIIIIVIIIVVIIYLF